MESGIRSTETKSNILHRVARIWSLVIIAIGLFILEGEAYAYLATEPSSKVSYPWSENLIPLTLITSVLGMIIAWRWECAGAAITIVSLLVNLLIFYLVIGGRGERPSIVFVILTPDTLPGSFLGYIFAFYSLGFILP